MAFNPFGFIGDGINAIGNVISTVLTNRANEKMTESTNAANMQMNAENIAFQQSENEIARGREDNAIQRRANDLTAAGLSKTLAAGSPASANAMNAPNNSFAMQSPHYEAPNFSMNLNNWSAVKQAEIAEGQLQLERDKFEHQRTVDNTELGYRGREVSVAEASQRIEEDWKSYQKKLNSKEFDFKVESTYRSLGQKDVELAQGYRALGQKDTEISLSRERLGLERVGVKASLLDTMSNVQLRDSQIALNKANSALTKITGKQKAVEMSSTMFNDMLAFRSYLNTFRFTSKQMQSLDADIKYKIAQTVHTSASTKNLDASTKKTLQAVAYDMYDASKSIANGEYIGSSKPNCPELDMQNRSIETTTKNTLINIAGSIAGSIAGGLAYGGAQFAIRKKFGDQFPNYKQR